MAWWRRPNEEEEEEKRIALFAQGDRNQIAIREQAATINWRIATETLPDGPVDLWVAILSTDGRILGGAPLPDGGRMTWWWENGSLAGRIPGISIDIWESGNIWDTLLVAVAGGHYAVVKQLSVSCERNELRKKDKATFPYVNFTFPE